MDFTLPVANTFVNPLFVLGLGWIGGFLSGLLGVGGGIIITPTLMVMGVPPLIAVASQVNHSIGTCLTGLLNYRRNNDVDFQLGAILLGGGVVGAILGTFFLQELIKYAQAILILTVAYASVLGVMSWVLFRQSLKTLAHFRLAIRVIQPPAWTRHIFLKIYFTRSRIELSVLLPLLVGIINGVLTASLGVGNGVFMMPAMCYLIGRTSPVIYGTTLLAGVGMSIVTTLIYAIGSHAVDLSLVFILLGGGILGSHMGVKFGYTLPRPYVGMIGAFVILVICLRMVWTLPASTHSASTVSGMSLNVMPCPRNSISFLQDLAHYFPIFHALAGVAGAIVFSLLLDCVFQRFSVNHFFQRDK